MIQRASSTSCRVSAVWLTAALGGLFNQGVATRWPGEITAENLVVKYTAFTSPPGGDLSQEPIVITEPVLTTRGLKVFNVVGSVYTNFGPREHFGCC